MNADLFIQIGLASAALFYSLIVLGFIIGLMKVRHPRSPEQPFVSVIVAARNEESNLSALLPALLQQDYPTYEVIVANDRSTDKTAEVVRNHQHNAVNLKLVDITTRATNMPGKKNALALAIEMSKGEILCFTDADCVPTKQWVSELVAGFDPHVGLVAGYSPYDESLAKNGGRGFAGKLLQKFICYEELKAAAWSAGAIGLKKGWLCTGRNLAYRKKMYDEVGGYKAIKHSISGDDDLLLQLVRRRTSWEIRYVRSPESFVRTAPPESFSAFVEQRKRHFSATQYFPFSMKLFFFLFHFSNLMLFAGFLGFLFGITELAFGLPCFAVKLAADVTLFLLVSEMLSQRGLAAYFLPMEILYIFYNTFIGPLGLIRSFEWKPDPKA